MTNEQIQKVFHKAVAMCDESGFHADSLVQTVGYHRKRTHSQLATLIVICSVLALILKYQSIMPKKQVNSKCLIP